MYGNTIIVDIDFGLYLWNKKKLRLIRINAQKFEGEGVRLIRLRVFFVMRLRVKNDYLR